MKKIFLTIYFYNLSHKMCVLPIKPLMLFVLIIFAPVVAFSADTFSQDRFHPYISVEEEYNDNLDLTSNNKKKDFITTIKPGLKYSNMDTFSGIDLDYNAGFVFYGQHENLNYISHNASLNAKYLTKEHFNFFLKDSFIRSDDPREREYFTPAEENKFVLSTETQREKYWRNVLSPTVEYQFGPQNRIGVNYRNNIYRIDSSNPDDSQEDFVNPFFSWKLDQKNDIYLDYGYTIGNFESSADFTSHKATMRYTNHFGPKSSVFGEYNFSTRNFDPPSVDYDIHQPFIGVSYSFNPNFDASAQIGYFVKDPETGSRTDGMSYKAGITNRNVKTSYVLSLQGGYNEDYFTSENLGFSRYHRLTGSITHSLAMRTSLGLYGNVERSTFDTGKKDWIWGTGCNLSHKPLKWLTLYLDISHKNKDSNISTDDYTENRGIFKITATY
ncbi:MAG: outer membrane beta-barrel protein [Proteobacteria bacterium]|nr:outer membrane beta-barrel protein [Pseudomonadota bacterium]